VRAAPIAIGAVVAVVLAGCQHDAAHHDAAQQGDPAAPSTSATADVSADAHRFSACGASFDLPSDWAPEPIADGQWQAGARTAAGRGLTLSIRCLPDAVILPGTPFTEIDAVRDELGYGRQTLHRGTAYYQAWRDGLPDRPGVIALLQKDDDGPGRIEVAVWVDPDKRSAGDPPSTFQGLLAMHWSDDDPTQRAQYTALRTQITSTFSAPLPDTHGRTRAP